MLITGWQFTPLPALLNPRSRAHVAFDASVCMVVSLLSQLPAASQWTDEVPKLTKPLSSVSNTVNTENVSQTA
jgi:hypothetical protein